MKRTLKNGQKLSTATPSKPVKIKSWRKIKPLKIRDAGEFMRKEPVSYNSNYFTCEYSMHNSQCLQAFPSFSDELDEYRDELDEYRNKNLAKSKIEQAKEVYLKEILKKIRVPSLEALKGKYFNRFRKWCVKNKINPDTQTAQGKAFTKYKNELEQASQQKKARAIQVKDLFKVVGRMWTSGEAVQEDEENNGWNDCLFEYIKTGIIPPKKELNRKKLDMYQYAQAVGFNQARERLIKKDYSPINQ